MKTGGQRKKRSWSFGDLGLPDADLSHAVLVLLAEAAQLAVEVDVDLEVEVALVAEVGPHSEDAEDLLALLGGDVVLHVEDSLLPVRVGGLGGGGKAHPLVALGELNVEEGHQGLKTKDTSQAFER